MYIKHTFIQNYGDGEQISGLGLRDGGEDKWIA